MGTWAARAGVLAMAVLVTALAAFPASTGAGFTANTTTAYTISTGAYAPPQRIWSAGLNTSGTMGDSTITSPRKYLVEAAGSTTTWTTVTMGQDHGCGLRQNGTIWCWGSDGTGALGNGASGNSLSPTQAGSATNWISVDAWNYGNCALNTAHELWCWGGNSEGVSGQGTTSGQTQSPTKVGTDTDWASLGVGGNFACAVKNSGQLWCWGLQNAGQVGQGVSGTPQSTPVRLGTDSDWSRLGNGQATACAIKTTGTLWCWGRNAGRQAIPTTPTNPILSPTQLGSATDWASASGGTADTTAAHTCAINTSGELYCWGVNGAGQVGQGNTTTPVTSVTRIGPAAPSPAWTSVSAGADHTIATKADGTVWAWGANDNGQLGLGHVTARTSPWPVPAPFGGAIASTVSAGQTTSAVGYATAGSRLFGAGVNSSNNIGDGSGLQKTSLTETSGSVTTWATVTEGTNHACAIRLDGTLWCWGADGSNQLGNGAGNATSTPGQAGSATNWKSVSSAGYATCAINALRELWCWGSNTSGVTARATSTGNTASPTKVGTDTDWDVLSLGGAHACATKTTGTLWCWGDQAYAQTGQGVSGTPRNTVQQLGVATDWTNVFGGQHMTCATKSTGALYCWGRNHQRQAIPTSATDPITTVTQVGSATNWVTGASGSTANPAAHTCAINALGEMYCWGLNADGQVGRGNVTTPASAVTLIGTVTPNPGWASVAAGVDHTVATKTDGSLWTWGGNGNGQLGLGSVVTPKNSPQSVTAPFGGGLIGVVAAGEYTTMVTAR